MTAPVRLGASCWNQWSDWPAFMEAQQRADRLGYDSLWTWDHLYPILGSPEGPIFEGHMAMSAVAASTNRASVGLLVSANTFRNPALLVKMVTTLDHVSGGRAVLGIGAAWFEKEHKAFGMPFGASPGQRLTWLGEALPIIRGMLDGAGVSVDGDRYTVHELRNDPPPLQDRLRILVGGSGRRLTLRLVARWADACNVAGSLADIRSAEDALLSHCASVGRDEREIERTAGMGILVIRDTREEAERLVEDIAHRNGDAVLRFPPIAGPPDDVVARCAPLVEMGYRHLIFGFPAPYDAETMTRLAQEVRPLLERLTDQ